MSSWAINALQRYQQIKVHTFTTAGGRSSSLCCTLSPHRTSLVQTFLCISVRPWHHVAQRVSGDDRRSCFCHQTSEQSSIKAPAILTVTMEAADVLLSDVHRLDCWADLEWREGVWVTFRDTTFIVALMNKRWVRGGYSRREGQKTVFVGVLEFKNGQKRWIRLSSNISVRKRRSGWMFAPVFREKSVNWALFYIRLMWIKRMWQHDVGDSSAHPSSWFFERSTHVTGALKGAFIRSESDNRLVNQTNVSLFTAETESQQKLRESRSE